MTKTEENRTNPIGLDVGTSRIVTARQADEGYAFEGQLNAFVRIPHLRMTENALARDHVPFVVEGGTIMVHGNESERFAGLLNIDLCRPMTRGILNAGEPDSFKVIRHITSALLGDVQAGQKICFTVPAAPLDAQQDLTYHEATLRQLLSELGYEVSAINEGLAVVYSELADTNYTGIGVSCGGGLCNVCFAYLSVPVLSFSIAKAGDFIDASAASVSGELANSVRIVKEESFHLNGHFSSKVHQVLGVYYDEMLRAVVAGMKEAFASRRPPKVSRPIPLVLSGGSALPQGFRDRFEKILRESEFPVPLSEVRLAGEPLTSTAKGALVAALAEA